MHVTHNNNITIAYATSLATTTIKKTTTTHHNALVTRGDLVSTSKYYKYHKALGHTPQHIQHVSDRQKKTASCWKWPPNTNAQESFSYSRQINHVQKAKIKHNKCITNSSHGGPLCEGKLFRAPAKHIHISINKQHNIHCHDDLTANSRTDSSLPKTQPNSSHKQA